MNIPMTLIVADERVQPRVGGLDGDHVRALMESAEYWPPLTAVQYSGRYILVDGFHRLAAAQNLGWDAVPIDVVDIPADHDLQALAFQLNARHGRPLSLADRRAFAARLLGQHPEWADREIARRSGLSGVTVAKVRQGLAQGGQIAEPGIRVGARGYTFTAPQIDTTPTEADTRGDKARRGDDDLTPADRQGQRRIADHIRRALIVFEEQRRLTTWRTADDAADACQAVWGTERATALAEDLGIGARNLLDVAEALGWDPEADA